MGKKRYNAQKTAVLARKRWAIAVSLILSGAASGAMKLRDV